MPGNMYPNMAQMHTGPAGQQNAQQAAQQGLLKGQGTQPPAMSMPGSFSSLLDEVESPTAQGSSHAGASQPQQPGSGAAQPPAAAMNASATGARPGFPAMPGVNQQQYNMQQQQQVHQQQMQQQQMQQQQVQQQMQQQGQQQGQQHMQQQAQQHMQQQAQQHMQHQAQMQQLQQQPPGQQRSPNMTQLPGMPQPPGMTQPPGMSAFPAGIGPPRPLAGSLPNMQAGMPGTNPAAAAAAAAGGGKKPEPNPNAASRKRPPKDPNAPPARKRTKMDKEAAPEGAMSLADYLKSMTAAATPPAPTPATPAAAAVPAGVGSPQPPQAGGNVGPRYMVKGEDGSLVEYKGAPPPGAAYELLPDGIPADGTTAAPGAGAPPSTIVAPPSLPNTALQPQAQLVLAAPITTPAAAAGVGAGAGAAVPATSVAIVATTALKPTASKRKAAREEEQPLLPVAELERLLKINGLDKVRLCCALQRHTCMCCRSCSDK